MTAMMALVGWAWTVAPTYAQEPEGNIVVGVVQGHEDRLFDAVADYQRGRHDQAQLALARLIGDSTCPETVRQSARVYLGEVLYTTGDIEGARDVFGHVLAADPEYQVDPFQHPAEIIAQFEIARSSVVRIVPEPLGPLVVPPLPPSAFMGFGLYQLREGRQGTGAVLLVGQTALAAVSVTTMVQLFADRSWDAGDEAKRQKVITKRNLQWGSTAGFWSLHVVGLLDAQADWRRQAEQGRQARLPVGFQVTGRF